MMRSRKAFLFPMALLAAFAQEWAQAETLPAYAEPSKIATLENDKINESSGLAVSRRAGNRFWTHNDSGDKPRLFCFDQQGRHLGTSKLKDAKAVDWEDICSFELDGRAWILIADTGDNGVRRKSCRLYLAEEPKSPGDEIDQVHQFRLTYSSGPMDCEAIGVDATSRKLLLVEKRRWITCRVFEAELPRLGQKDVVAHPIASVNLPMVTAMDVSPDGRRAIVLTLGQAFEFHREQVESWSDAFNRKPRTIGMPARRQGEAICYGADGNELFLTSELTPTPFFKVAVENK